MGIKLCNTNSLFQSFMQSWLTKDMISVDMTVGNGNDSEFLLKHNIKYLYGFDIQKTAILITEKRLKDQGIYNFSLYQDNHKFLKNYIKEEIDLFVYNLGYLPKGDKKITTNGSDVIESLKNALQLLKRGGMVWITFYPGHSAGLKESIIILEFLENLDQKDFYILKMDYINQINSSPFIVALEKR